MKILFFFFLMMLSTTLASAYDVYINGVYYNIDYIAKTAEVTFLNKDAYSGSVNIPATLTNVNITTKASMEFTDQGFDNAQEISIITLSDCTTLTFNAGTNKNAPKYYYSGTSIRMYPGNFLTVTAASGKTLASIVITYSVNNAEGQISASSGTVAVNNMAVTISAINATTTTITNSHTGLGASSQLRLVSITITYMEDCDAATYNVTSIGNSAFYGCSNLTSVTIPNSVTSIGDRAFYGCI